MMPLDGIRVIDFGHVWAGPYTAATLADLGADVIKIESPKRLDVHRRQGPYPDNEAGVNRSGVWNAQNRNKKSVALNLTDDAQREHAKGLVRQADVVIENFSPGVMKKLGLDYATLREIKPDLIMASLSAFGQQGPQSAYVGYGPSLDAWSGLCSLNAYPDEPPLAVGGMFPDTASALYASFAIMSALRRRARTGEGTYIDLSELEVSALLLADLLVQFPGEDIPQAWVGNADPYMRVQGTYPCKGDDAWIIISIDDNAAWQGLCTVLGGEPKGDVDNAIRKWTRTRTADEAFKELQAHDVPAGAGLNIAQLLEDEQLQSRDFFRVVQHPEVGQQTIYAPIWRFDGVAGETRAAPLLGQDTDAVLAALHEVR
ncbi:MAG TPA: CoA transferase [Candidatus Baltobacteraceae bacterium]|jgi:benzylsuccinate CoA-transferase BbsF subunit